MKNVFVVANWKMNPSTVKEAEGLFQEVEKFKKENCQVVICPPSPFLYLGKKSVLGSQDCFFEKKGAFTGEVSPSMLKSMGCLYVILGHSERRRFFKEENEDINRKIKGSIAAGLTPILCVGEDDSSDASTKIKNQITEGLKGVPLKKVIIAYEPLSAIGTGKPYDINLAAKRRVFIRSILSKIDSKNQDIPVLYGGSVNEKNCKKYIEEAQFEGLLVGGASLKPEKFKKILENL